MLLVHVSIQHWVYRNDYAVLPFRNTATVYEAVAFIWIAEYVVAEEDQHDYIDNECAACIGFRGLRSLHQGRSTTCLLNRLIHYLDNIILILIGF